MGNLHSLREFSKNDIVFVAVPVLADVVLLIID